LLMGQGDKLVDRSPEKAGVGGSTPSLATMFSMSHKKLLKLPQKQKALYRGWKQRTRRRTPELHLIECHPFAAMRRVEERSLSSILRSKLLTTLINNDVWGKVNAGGCATALDKSRAMSFASRIGGDQAPVSRTL
jgi:hypothetical protein